VSVAIRARGLLNVAPPVLLSTGSNTSGRNGNGLTTGAQRLFEPVITDVDGKSFGSLDSLAKLGGGDAGTGLVLRDGFAWSWGSTRGSTQDDGPIRPTPIRGPVANPVTPSGVTGLSMGGLTASGSLIIGGCGIWDDKLWVWGNHNSTIYDQPTEWSAPGVGGWTSTARGAEHALAIRNGELWSWGNNGFGATGLGTSTGTTTTPTKVGSFEDWVYIAAGDYFSLGIRSNGALYSWGNNANGRTGLGTTSGSTLVPTVVGALTWANVDCGGTHAVGVTTDGNLYTWGENTNGRTGLGLSTGNTLTPTQVVGANQTGNWVKAAAGRSFSAGLNTGNFLGATGTKLLVWGRNDSNLGFIGLTNLVEVLVPTTPKTLRLTGFYDVACGATNTYVLQRGVG
jgi:alpha-tubulin suppressor-like RCC1 family protein